MNKKFFTGCGQRETLQKIFFFSIVLSFLSKLFLSFHCYYVGDKNLVHQDWFKFSIGCGGFLTSSIKSSGLSDSWKENHDGNESSKRVFSNKSSDSQEQQLWEFVQADKSCVLLLKLAEIYPHVSHARAYNRVAIELYLSPKGRENINKPLGERDMLGKEVGYVRGRY